jgi:ribosomal protein L29
MKRNDITQLHDKTLAELRKQLEETRRELARVRLERAVGKAALSKVRLVADDVARVLTVITEKEFEAAVQAVAAAVEDQATVEAETK